MPIEAYPTCQEAGAAVGRLVRARLAGLPDLDDTHCQAVADYLGELTQKALEIQFVVNQCLAIDGSDKLEVADLLAMSGILAAHIATWRDNVEQPLLEAVERLRETARLPARADWYDANIALPGN